MAEQTIPESVRTSLECKACHKFLRPPIRICKNGHNMCDLCKTARESTCPTCQETVMDITNIELEAFIKHFKAPMSCKFNGDGCTETKDLDDILLHEEDCLFRGIKCMILDCKAHITFNELENHMADKHQDMEDGTWAIRKSESAMDADLCEMAKLMVKGASIVRGRDWNHGNQDGNPPGTGIVIGPYGPNYPGWIQVTWGNGSTYNHRMGADGKYELKLAPISIRTWRCSNVRFYATLFLGSDDFWHIMVSAACGKNKAAKFRAEIRLASSNVPECSNIYHRPVEHLESEIVMSTMEKYSACLDVHKKDVEKQTGGKFTSLEMNPEDIPFTCKVYEKVFVTFDKEDIEEKEN